MVQDILALIPERSSSPSEARKGENLAKALLRVADCDRDAFEEVYRQTSPRLFGICLQMLSSRPEAEDVLQDVYCSVWLGAGSFDVRRGTAMSWLITIARNRSIDQLRRSRPAATVPIERACRVADPRPLPFDVVASDDEHQKMGYGLGLLSARDANALKMAFFAGSTYADLARTASIPVGTMKSRIRRALIKIRNGMA